MRIEVKRVHILFDSPCISIISWQMFLPLDVCWGVLEKWLKRDIEIEGKKTQIGEVKKRFNSLFMNTPVCFFVNLFHFITYAAIISQNRYTGYYIIWLFFLQEFILHTSFFNESKHALHIEESITNVNFKSK